MWYVMCPMRNKSIARREAAAICRERLLEAQSGQPLSDLSAFQRSLVDSGVLQRPISGVTLWKILAGRYYPELEDPFTGEPINFSKLAQLTGAARRAADPSVSKAERIEQLEREVRALRRRIEDLELGAKSVELLPPVSTPPPAPRAVAVVPASFEVYCEQRGFTPSYRTPEKVGITPRSSA